VAAITNAEILNYVNVASETGISARIVKSYFEILMDTMLGFLLPPWKKSTNRRMIRTPKFYFFDTGVANFLAKRQPLEGSREFGKSFEHYILMEILNYRRYKNPDLDISYWRTSTGLEVDYILGAMAVAVEVKGKKMVGDRDLSELKVLAEENRRCRKIVVSMEEQARKSGDVEILPWQVFLERLYAGKIV